MKRKSYFYFLFVLCLLFIFSSTSYAKTLDIDNLTSNIYGMLFNLGVILAVCLTAVISISYMVSNPNKKAVLKERLIYYFIGVIFLVGGLAFLRFYAEASSNVGDVVYDDGAASNIKNYFTSFGSGASSENSSPPKASYKDENGEVRYTDSSVDMIQTASKLKKSDIDLMGEDDLETFVNTLSFAISDVKAKLADGTLTGYSGMERSIQEAESNLSYARDSLALYKAPN